MLIAFLIMLREGIEAALIVGIIAGFLKQSGNDQLMPKVWAGIVLAAFSCLALGMYIHQKTGEIPQKQQEFWVAVIGFIAVGMLTYMIFWMQKAGHSIKKEIHESINTALNKGKYQGWALVSMAFLAVAREGLESIFFLLAVFKQSPNWEMPVGAVSGLITAIIIGALIYKGAIKINLAKFFKITGIFLIIIAAGLLAGSLRALHEAGIWNHLQTIAFNSSHILHEDSILGTIMGGFFGYTDHPTHGEIIIWLAYLIPAIIWYTKPYKKIS